MRMRRTVTLLTLMLAGCSSPSPAPSTLPQAQLPPPAVTVTPIVPPVAPPPTRGSQFSQVFWDQFVHNAFDAPAGRVPLQRLPASPMLYLKTVDEAGRPIDAVTLQTVQDAMSGSAAIWGGGQFGLRGVERGTGTKDGLGGWITVKWLAADAGALCGRSTTGVDGGFIELNYLHATCTCGGASRIYPRLARHELGHAFGYWHTDSGSDVMYGQTLTTALDCNLSPSVREVYHAQLAYQSPVGTADRVSVRPVILD